MGMNFSFGQQQRNQIQQVAYPVPFDLRYSKRYHDISITLKDNSGKSIKKQFTLDLIQRQQLFKGQGEPGKDGKNKDLLVVMQHSRPPPPFAIVQGIHLKMSKVVNLFQFLCEYKFKINICDKTYIVDHSKIYQKQLQEITGAGLPVDNEGKRGNIYVEYQLQIPDQTFTAAQRKSLKQIK